MNENSLYWILGVAVIALIFTVAGLITGRKLPENRRKVHIQKYAALGLTVMAFSIPLFKPLVSPHAGTRHLDELKIENLDSTERLAELEKEQSRQIEQLKEEVVLLRDDLYAMNLYYGMAIQFSSIIFGVFALNFFSRKRKEENDLEKSNLDAI